MTPDGVKSPQLLEPSKPKTRIERLLENLTGTTENNYHSNIKSANIYDRSYLESGANLEAPMPVLPKTHVDDFIKTEMLEDTELPKICGKTKLPPLTTNYNALQTESANFKI